MNLLERSWHVVARSDDVDERPRAAELLGRRLVVARTPGRVAVLLAACPHRGTDLALGDVVDGCIRCPYHGWRFAPSGTCTHIPSQPTGPIPPSTSATALAVVERAGLVWASLDAGADPGSIPALPDREPGLRTIVGEPMVWATSAGRHVENILDLGHFAFVHPATFGCPEAEVVAPHEVVRDGPRISAEVDVTTRNPGGVDGPMYAGLGPRITIGYRYEVTAPYRITLRFAFPDGMRRELHEVVTPDRHDRCTIHWRLLVDERLGSDDADELAFAHQVFAEDRPLIESQPPGLPLEPTAEVHLGADRLAVAYRRLLRDLGCTTADHV
jgi:phenylpropionate dioxygenase-like ring-hydroxylating dioxygenase large terminal subunit